MHQRGSGFGAVSPTQKEGAMHELTDLPTAEAAPQDRLRRLPEALVLTASYYASRIPVVNDLLRRLG
jgi:hypothetical protein